MPFLNSFDIFIQLWRCLFFIAQSNHFTYINITTDLMINPSILFQNESNEFVNWNYPMTKVNPILPSILNNFQTYQQNNDYNQRGIYFSQFGGSYILSSTEINQRIQQNSKNEIHSRKNIYGKGPEIKRMMMLPHFRQPVANLEMFHYLGKLEKNEINDLGSKYNIQFQEEIKGKNYPRFKREHKRNKNLAIWFFEDIKHLIIPWLKELGLIKENI